MLFIALSFPRTLIRLAALRRDKLLINTRNGEININGGIIATEIRILLIRWSAWNIDAVTSIFSR